MNRAVLVFVATIAVVMVFVVSIDLALPTQSGPPVLSNGTSSAVNPKNGLELVLTLNTTTPSFGGGVLIGVDERNPLLRVNNVTASGDWPVLGISLSGPKDYCPQRDAMGIVVFQGWFTNVNGSQDSGERLYPEGALGCPERDASYSYLFQPGSDNATEAHGCNPGAPSSFSPGSSCGCGLNPCAPLEIGPAETRASIAVEGYYYFGAGGFHKFPPGPYTVVAGDEWGDVAVAHFIVSNPGCNVLQASLPFPAGQDRYHGVLNTPGAWAFFAELNSTVAFGGHNVTVTSALDNVAPESQDVSVGIPRISGVQVLSSNGSVVWEHEPPITTHRLVANGENLRDSVVIPTAQLQVGQTYRVIVRPTFYDQGMNSLWNDLTISAPLLVC